MGLLFGWVSWSRVVFLGVCSVWWVLCFCLLGVVGFDFGDLEMFVVYGCLCVFGGLRRCGF